MAWARGGKLGTVANLTREAGRRGARTNRTKARTAYASLLPQLREWRAAGLSFARISARLNDSGHTTRSGALWNPRRFGGLFCCMASDCVVGRPPVPIHLSEATSMTSGKTFHFRIRLENGNIINTSQWAHDIFQAQCMISQRYPGCVVLQVVNE